MALSISSLSSRNQMIVYAVLMLGVASAFHIYYLQPLGQEIAELQVQVDGLAQEVAQGEAVQRQVPELEREVILQQERLQSLRDILPDEKETAQIIREVHDTAVDANLQIKSFTPQPTISHAFYDDWPILISVEGNFENLGAFFEEISEFDRLVNVGNITLHALEDSPDSDWTIAATCTATTYVYREPTAEQLEVTP